MREFRNPGKILGGLFGGVKRTPIRIVKDIISTTKDGDEPAKKPSRARGISSQRSTLLTAGSATGQETQRRSLLGVS